jgi:CheY-like chemotaxis protein
MIAVDAEEPCLEEPTFSRAPGLSACCSRIRVRRGRNFTRGWFVVGLGRRLKGLCRAAGHRLGAAFLLGECVLERPHTAHRIERTFVAQGRRDLFDSTPPQISRWDSVHDPLPDAIVSAARHTVLYIEDNASNLRLLERLFAHRPGIELISATRGLPGIEMARDRHPVVVLLDLDLPDISGDEVLQRLRDDPSTKTIPVVMLSAEANYRQIQRLLQTGASAYLTKPLDAHNLLNTVDELISEVTPTPQHAE